MARLITRTVSIEAPLPFTDQEAEALIEAVDLTLDLAIDAAVRGTLDAVDRKAIPLVEAVVVKVSE